MPGSRYPDIVRIAYQIGACKYPMLPQISLRQSSVGQVAMERTPVRRGVIGPWAFMAIAKLYGPQASNDTTLARLEFRDGYFASEARWIASKVSAAGTPAYLYRFEYVLGVLQCPPK
jgi:carboxylesterase type B